jgi:hypothetical protein
MAQDIVDSTDDFLALSEESLRLAKELAPIPRGLFIAARNVGMLGTAHQTTVDSAEIVAAGLTGLMTNLKIISLDVGDQTFAFDDIPIYGDGQASSEKLIGKLKEQKVGRINFKEGIGATDILHFLDLLHRAGPESDRQALSDDLDAIGCTRVTLEDRDGDDLPDADDSGFVLQMIGDPRKVYQVALDIMRELHCDVLNTGAVDTVSVDLLVDNVLDQLTNGNPSLVVLAMQRGYDDRRYTHPVNVCILSAFIGARFCSDNTRLRELMRAALLHDISKYTYSAEDLPEFGDWGVAESPLPVHHRDSAKLIDLNERIEKLVAVVAFEHHMHHDGTGTPHSSDGRELNLFSALVSVCDALDDLLQGGDAERLEVTHALQQLAAARGSLFAAEVVDQLLMLLGTTPVGAVVQLETGAFGVVVGHNPGKVNAPIVQMYTDPSGGFLASPLLLGGIGSVFDAPPVVHISDDVRHCPLAVNFGTIMESS